MRPFNQDDNDGAKQSVSVLQPGFLHDGPVDDDAKPQGSGLVRAKKLRQDFKEQSIKNRERGRMVFGESRNKLGDDIVVEQEVKRRQSLNITDGNIEAPKSYAAEGEDCRNKGNALHEPFRHFKSLSFYDKLKFGFKLFGCGISAMSLLLDILYFNKAIFMNQAHYDAFSALLILRFTFILIYSVGRYIQQASCFRVDITKVRGTNTLEMTNEEKAELEKSIKMSGMMFYVAQPALSWFGTYRIYPVKDFMYTLILNFVCELFLQTLPLTLVILQANT